MTKNEYLSRLDAALRQLPESERQKHISWYSELFADMEEDGISEEEAARKLEDPADAAQQILEDTPLPLLIKSRATPKRGWTVLTIVLAVLSSVIWLPVGLAGLAVMLSIYVVIWSVVVVFFAVVVSLVASGIACIAAPFLQLGLTPPNAMLVVGCGMVLLALGILAFFGAVAAAKGMVRLTADVARAIRKLFIRKENER